MMTPRPGWTFVLVGTLVVCSCSTSSGDTSGTTGSAITLQTAATIRDDLTLPTTNALGWTVTLSKAYLSVGALYYFAGDPVISRRAPRANDPLKSTWAWLGALVERNAYAHPGHYIQGQAMGQMLTPTTLDLLGGSVAFAAGTGITGMVNSARFTWQSPPIGDNAPALAGHVVLTQGLAVNGNSTVHFVATADANDVLDADGKPEVNGCPFGTAPGQVGANMDANGNVTLTLVPTVWFDQVDFSYILPAGQGDGGTGASPQDDGGVDIDAASLGVPDGAAVSNDAGAVQVGSPEQPVDLRGTIAWRGFLRGVKKGTGYLFSYSK